MKNLKKIFNVVLYFIISFIITQGLVYLLSKDNFFTSPTYVLLPVFGFFSLYLLTKPILVDLKINKIKLIVSFLIVCLLGYYFALFFYNYNIYVILNNMPIRMNFFNMFLKSSFLTFVVSGLFGILFSK
jgi:hypothetical protein